MSELLTRLNPKTARFDIGTGGIHEITDQDIAATNQGGIVNRTDTKSTRGNFQALVATSLVHGINDYYLAKEAEARGRQLIQLQGEAAPRSVAQLVGWLESDEEFPFSFAWSCAALELDPRHVRERVKSFRSLAEMRGSIASKSY